MTTVEWLHRTRVPRYDASEVSTECPRHGERDLRRKAPHRSVAIAEHKSRITSSRKEQQVLRRRRPGAPRSRAESPKQLRAVNGPFRCVQACKVRIEKDAAAADMTTT